MNTKATFATVSGIALAVLAVTAVTATPASAFVVSIATSSTPPPPSYASSVSAGTSPQNSVQLHFGGASSTASTTATASTSVSATTTSSSGVTTTIPLDTRFQNVVNRANEEIARRINALNALEARVNSMQTIKSADQASLSASVQSQVTALNSLSAQISSDAEADSTSSLLTDAQSITTSYRIFALVIPQGAIEAAADRVLTVANLFTHISGVFSARLTAAENLGSNVDAALASYTDMNAKIKAAQAAAQTAISAVVPLAPDNGVASVKQSNTATLQNARTQVQNAQQELVAARDDANIVIKALSSSKTASSSASSTSSIINVTASTSAPSPSSGH